MKKTLAALCCLLLLLGLSACETNKEEETTAPEGTTVYEYNGPSLEEMSPPSLSTAIPVDLPKTYAEVDKSGFQRVKAKDSYWPETEATAIYASGATQYFIMEGGVVYAITANEDQSVFYSACYDAEGKLSYIGDDNEYSWFFTEDGEFDYMSYTYTLPNNARVISFYEGEDTRFAVYAGQTYYDGDLNELNEEQKIQLVTRVAAAFSMMGGMNDL